MKFSPEVKQAFFDAFLKFRSEGDSCRTAYKHAADEFTAAGKLAPSRWQFRNWYKDRMTGKETAAESAPETEAQVPEQVEEQVPEQVHDEVLSQEEEADQPADDYTKRLELICRMYRTHSEESRDALCDYLLPDLCCNQTEEQ